MNLPRWIAVVPTVLRQILRAPVRSGLTIFGIAVAMFLFTSVEAMREGVRNATEAAADDATLVVYRENRFCPFASRLPQYYGDRIERMTRGGCYRSRWLRDLSISPDVTAHLAQIYGIEIAPHPMPVHLGHLNYEPSRIDTAIDKWHHDTLPLDFVMTVTDPAAVAGGRFEYFTGTKHEAAELAAAGRTPPPERVVAPDFPGPGYAIALHGDMVVHRAGPLDELTERISMVNGYVALDPSREEQSRSADLIAVDDPECLFTEWAKFAAWRSQGRLNRLIDGLAFGASPEAVADQLDAAVAEVTRAAAEMRAGARDLDHYGG